MADVGSTEARSQNTVYYDSLLTSTMFAYRKTLVDNIFKDNAFLAYMRMIGAVKSQNGGERIAIPLMYGDNKTIKTVGGYETLDTTPQEGLTTAFYEWAELGGTISISRKEERQNAGEGRILGLLEAKIKQAEMTMAEELNHQLLEGVESGAGTLLRPQSAGGNTGMNPLGWFLRALTATNPTDGNVGNIDAAAYDWWRCRVADASGASTPTGGSFGLDGTTFELLKQIFKKMYYWCSRGTGGAPDLGITTQEGYSAYESSLDANTRYMNTKMADMGFDTVKMKGCTMIWDERTPDVEIGTTPSETGITKGTLFLLNTKFYEIFFDSESDIVVTPFVEPENQTAKTAKILAMGNATCSNLRKMGVVYGVSEALAS